MTIEGIGPVENVRKLNKTEKREAVEEKKSFDSISISQEAVQQSSNYYAHRAVKDSPDIRTDKVESAKNRLEELSQNMDVLESVAEKLMQVFDI